jgi:hypothetical protein
LHQEVVVPAKVPAAIAVFFLLSAGAPGSAKPASDPSDANKLESAEKSLEVCEKQLARVLNGLSEPRRHGRRDGHAFVNKLESIAHKFEVVERRVEKVVAPLSERHVEDGEPMPEVASALEQLTARSEIFIDLLDQFLETAPPDTTPPEAFAVVQDLRDRIPVSLVYLNLDYYQAVIPIRFVEFVEPGGSGVSGDRLKHSVAVANEIFRPARLRFYVKKNLVIAGTDFSYLFLRDSNNEPVLDENDNRIHVDYVWPEDWWTSPLIWPLNWPDFPDCAPVLPPATLPLGERIETRYSAQERAGTYCSREGEIIVYINQGVSNGGQYPWYTRIIGMSADHMATPESEHNKYVFAHELGHYFGLPHTFPSVKHYGRDYDLARIVTPPSDEVPLATIRRWYEPHANLWDVETNQMAPLSMFWDQVFRPGPAPDGPQQHLFFNSREEAAAHEGALQPISEWYNTFYFRPGQILCGDFSSAMKVAHYVTAGCRGGPSYFGDCTYPVQRFCTADPQVRAFAQLAIDPDRIRVNVMNYGYPMADGTDRPYDLIEGNFLSASQIEQIDRVMKPENDVTTRYFPEMTGMRPQLRTCEGCHSQLPGAAFGR